MKSTIAVLATGALCTVALPIQAAPDWAKVPAKNITLFYPGVASLEWTLTGTEHGGARAMRKGETCASCHNDETSDMGKKIVSGQKVEPNAAGVKGKSGSVPLAVQAAYDANNIYVRMAFKQPAGGGPKTDAKNPMKVALMFEEGGKVEHAKIGGCWATCHADLRAMPDVDPNASKHARAKALDIRDNGPTKYLVESRTGLELKAKPLGGWDKLKSEADIAAALKEGKFMELWQFRSGDVPRAGYVLDARHLSAAKGLAEGKNDGGQWTVTFTRKLAGGSGAHTFAAGKSYYIGFAIHDDGVDTRYHHVSLGYRLALDDAKADINAVKQ